MKCALKSVMVLARAVKWWASPVTWKAWSHECCSRHTPRIDRFSIIQYGAVTLNPTPLAVVICTVPGRSARTTMGLSAVPGRLAATTL